MAKFKVGDRVRCAEEAGFYHEGYGTVEVIDENDNTYLVLLDDFGKTWWYWGESLSPLHELTTLKWHTPDDVPDDGATCLVMNNGAWFVAKFSDGFFETDWEQFHELDLLKWAYLPE